MTSFNHETPSQEELEKSNRWFKSATPKYTLDWYIKWVASIFILVAMSMRGVEGLQLYDLIFSITGVAGWLVVSAIWEDRALIIVNSFGLLFMLKNLVTLMVN